MFTNYLGQQKRPTINNLLETIGADVYVAASPENFAYVSNAYLPNMNYVRMRQAFCVLTKTEAFIICFDHDAKTVCEQTWIDNVIAYSEFEERPIDILVRELKARGVNGAKIGVCLDFLPYTFGEQLIAQLPEAEIYDGYAQVEMIRAIKTADEIKTIHSASLVAHDALLNAMQESKIGDSERTVCNRIVSNLFASGARTLLFSSFAAGGNGTQMHKAVSDRPIGKAEVIRFDQGARFGPWLSDMARTYASCSPTNEQRKLYRTLIEVQKETIAAVRPGVRCREVYQTCQEAARRRGVEFDYSHVGHSLGMELHENPMIHPQQDISLQEGMVMNIEPILFDRASELYMHTEDLLVVEADGARLLTRGVAPEEMPVLGEEVVHGG